ncbi:hypothetical protein OTK49_01010 [Vibrio coralliirubri]|uniref:hypothetical protein n=1 Tax=Vibrio coralliirubri TaxID=1516159 RepID=UPI002284A5D8|nr:hypothetical protein [Vibrio coralliirubri]MCY9861110.1 hypothetical protein [Vibrio coralliirubri]
MRLTNLDDVGCLMTSDWINGKKKFFALLEYISMCCVLLALLTGMLYDVIDEYQTHVVILFALFLVAMLVTLSMKGLCSLMWGYSYTDLLELPKRDCRLILEAIEKHDEFRFLKERIANMDRKLTILEGDFIKDQLKELESNLDEQACRALYGVH